LSTLAVSLGSLLPFDTSSIFYRTFELVNILLPPLLSLTVLSDSPQYVSAWLAILVLLILLVIFFKRKGTKDMKRVWDINISNDGVIDSITNYRSSMLLVTSISILAVDFPIFPRKFGKTETFGYGLMDLGVGGFVFAAGLTSPEGRGKETSAGRTVKTSIPLLLLGLARLTVVSLSGYHNNVAEYGLHWNFFFTLFAVKVLGCLVLPLMPAGRTVWVGSVVVAVIYEGILSFGAVDWILSDEPRIGLIDSNKEGLCSVLGFLAIYLAGVSWAKEIIIKPFTFTVLVNAIHDLTIWSVLMWLNLVYSTSFFLPPSRRLANYTFFTFVVAYNLSILTGFLLIEAAVIAIGEWKCGNLAESGRKEKKNRYLLNKKKCGDAEVNSKGIVPNTAKGVRACSLYRAISYNGLPYFLMANLLTGLVNLLVPTVQTEGCPAVLIVFTYQLLLSLVVLGLHSKLVKII